MGGSVSIGRVRDIELLSGLSDEEYEMVAKVCREEIYEEGSIIFNEGEISKKLCAVESGRVILEYEVTQGRRVMVGDEVKRGLFGWSALIAPYRYTATARATQRTTIIVIDGQQMQELCNVHPHMCAIVTQHLVRILARRLETLRKYVAEVLHYSQG